MVLHLTVVDVEQARFPILLRLTQFYDFLVRSVAMTTTPLPSNPVKEGAAPENDNGDSDLPTAMGEVFINQFRSLLVTNQNPSS